MNKVILIGNLTRDPEVRYSQSAEPVAVCKFGLAVNRRYKREGEQDVDFINCVAFGKLGEFVNKYFTKGKKIAVTGRLSVRNYEDNSGQKRTATEVVIEEAHFVESKQQSERNYQQNSETDGYYPDTTRAAKPAGSDKIFDEPDIDIGDIELPF